MGRDDNENNTSGQDWQYIGGSVSSSSGAAPRRAGDTARILPAVEVAVSQPRTPTNQARQSPPAYSHEPYMPYNGPAAGSAPARPQQEPGPRYRAEQQPARKEQQPAKVAAKRGPSACAILAGTFSLLLLSCALLAFATLKDGFGSLGRLGGIFPDFGLVTSQTVTIDTTRPAVINQIKGLNKLETVNYQVDKVVSGKSSGPLPDFLTSDKILLVAHGEVVAGIDLSKLGDNDIAVVSNTVVITMPKAEVLYSKLDNDKTYVYDRQTGVFNKPDPNLESEVRQAAEREILNTAMEDGLLDKAQQNAEQVLRTLVTGLGYGDVQFRPPK